MSEENYEEFVINAIAQLATVNRRVGRIFKQSENRVTDKRAIMLDTLTVKSGSSGNYVKCGSKNGSNGGRPREKKNWSACSPSRKPRDQTGQHEKVLKKKRGGGKR